MMFIRVELFAFAAHAAGHLRPAVVFPVGEALLDHLERFHVVGRREAAGALEGEEGIQTTGARSLAFFHRAKGPSEHMHFIGSVGIESADGHR